MRSWSRRREPVWSIFMALVNRGDDLLHAHGTELLPALFCQRLHIGDSLFDLFLSALRLRHDAGDPATVTGDPDGLAPLGGVAQLGDMRLRFSSRGFARG